MVHYFLSLFASILVFLPVAEAQDYRWKVDFNNDGYDDLAIGAPSTTVLGLENAGQVYILYGSDAGLKTSDVQIVRRGQLIDGEPFAGESVGANLQSGNFNCDQYTDLLVFESSIPNGGFLCCMARMKVCAGQQSGFQMPGAGRCLALLPLLVI
ncbi:MAG: integrin alpha [Pseudomonadota bacterium]